MTDSGCKLINKGLLFLRQPDTHSGLVLPRDAHEVAQHTAAPHAETLSSNRDHTTQQQYVYQTHTQLHLAQMSAGVMVVMQRTQKVALASEIGFSVKGGAGVAVGPATHLLAPQQASGFHKATDTRFQGQHKLLSAAGRHTGAAIQKQTTSLQKHKPQILPPTSGRLSVR